MTTMDTCLEERTAPKLNVLVLILLLLLPTAAALSLRLEQPKSGAFTIGQSAIGGCDRIGGSLWLSPGFPPELSLLLVRAYHSSYLFKSPWAVRTDDLSAQSEECIAFIAQLLA